MKKLTVSILVLLLLLGACGCDRLVGVRGGTTPKSSSSDPRFVKQPGQGMSEYDAYNYFERVSLPAAYAVDYYAGAGMPYDKEAAEVRSGSLYAPVISSTIASVEELEAYVAMFFGGDFLKNLRTEAGMDSAAPRYVDFDGVLYIDLTYEYEPMLFSFDLSGFTIVENTEEAIKFTVPGSYGDNAPLINRMILSDVGGWKITYWMPEAADASSSAAS